jgi:predicted TIM-barrel fold metal-dependent hydrolase
MKIVGPKPPIINVHSHVFTHHYVPPYLGKTIVPWPFYLITHLSFFVWIYKVYIKIVHQKYKPFQRRIRRFFGQMKRFIYQKALLRLAYSGLIFYIGLLAFFTVFDWLVSKITAVNTVWLDRFTLVRNFLKEHHSILQKPTWLSNWLGAIILILCLLVVPPIRKATLFLLNLVWSFFHILPGERSKELFNRYLMMARFAIYKKQGGIANKLKHQYPLHTQFVLLSMDMKYMGAGNIGRQYDFRHQLNELALLNKKEHFHAFLFIDPRRIREEGKAFFNYHVNNGEIVLLPCLIKEMMEVENFAGFKIYPALGYFPFEEELLPLWKYAQQRNLPIITHGIKGVIYYRGKLKNEWKYHAVFKESVKAGAFKPLFMPQIKNKNFQVNFTHPLNFLCLLEEPLLRGLIGQSKNKELKDLFGYEGESIKLKHDLANLKVSFAHFGGGEEWQKHLERDRDIYAQQIKTKPNTGVELRLNESAEIPWRRYENLWKHTDWYTIVCSMMMQYENFYADISYLVSDAKFYPMLKATVTMGEDYENLYQGETTYSGKNMLRKKVLFGSDFYVVRSQRSDKDIFTELQAALSSEELDLIMRYNPNKFLERHIS